MGEDHAFPFKFGSQDPGMTLREYFAAHAPAMPDGWQFQMHENATIAERRAAWAWKYAEAMMDRREDVRLGNRFDRSSV